jgi:chemotaxis protein MotB
MSVLSVVASVAVLSSGCVSLDKYNALDRSHRLLQDKLSEVQDDLQNCQLQNQQKDTQIAALKSEKETLQQTLASLQAENESLRNNLAKAQAILEKMAGTGTTTVMMPPLPADVNAALKELARQYPDFLEFDEAKGAVRWKADLLFELGSDTMSVSPEVAEAMKKFVQIVNMASAAKLDVIVVGHTCNTPIRRAETLARFKDNWYLSAGRAIAVMQMFHADGVGFERMGVMGYGEHRPIADNASKEGKAKNRRVEVYLVPHESVQAVGGGNAAVYQTKDSNLNFAKVGMESQAPKKVAKKAAAAPAVEQ